ncbi:hypothetical protein DL93DRAFT_290780 [Clavulina sp. PMI_390]|nr:hypothetical protein DL93DRAFT_290780 [Clavulina sp. PMI_390]
MVETSIFCEDISKLRKSRVQSTKEGNNVHKFAGDPRPKSYRQTPSECRLLVLQGLSGGLTAAQPLGLASLSNLVGAGPYSINHSHLANSASMNAQEDTPPALAPPLLSNGKAHYRAGARDVLLSLLPMHLAAKGAPSSMLEHISAIVDGKIADPQFRKLVSFFKEAILPLCVITQVLD